MTIPIFIPTPTISGGEWDLGIFGICIISLFTIFIQNILIYLVITALKEGEKFPAYIFSGAAFFILLIWVGVVFGLK